MCVCVCVCVCVFNHTLTKISPKKVERIPGSKKKKKSAEKWMGRWVGGRAAGQRQGSRENKLLQTWLNLSWRKCKGGKQIIQMLGISVLNSGWLCFCCHLLI